MLQCSFFLFNVESDFPVKPANNCSLNLKLEKNMSLQNKTDKQLMNLLHNTMTHPDRDRANAAKNAVYEIWSKRNTRFSRGLETRVMPWDGVLSAFGYHVGDSGISSSRKRQSILEHILEAPIPPVKDPAYPREWGKPMSKARKTKLKNALKGLHYGCSQRSDNDQLSYSRAMSHWQSDLEYLERLCG